MQNILITGTSSGVGFGLALHYLAQGENVYGISRKNNKNLDRYPNFTFLTQDLSEFELTRTNIPNFLTEVKSLDLVILNAGIINGVKDMRNTSLEEIKEVMDVNVWANKILIDLLFETVHKINQVVAISSGAAVSGSRGWNAYALSKACLNMLVELYSKELPECHFCALAPGLIETNMQDYVNSLSEETAKKYPVVQKLKDARGTEKMPSPQDAARIISESIKKTRKYESGSFLDVRKMH